MPSRSTPTRGASTSTGAGSNARYELGCMFSIDPDAHDTGEIDNVRWGVAMARKGGIPKDRILNCLDLAGLCHVARQAQAARSGRSTERRRGRGSA